MLSPDGVVAPGGPGAGPVLEAARRGGLAALAGAGIPAAAAAAVIVTSLPELAASEAFQRAVRADWARAERLRGTAAAAHDALRPLGLALPGPDRGWLWEREVRVLVDARDLPTAEAALSAAGFLGLDRLLGRLGRTEDGVRRFAARRDGEILGTVALSVRPGPGRPPAEPSEARVRASATGPSRSARRWAPPVPLRRRPRGVTIAFSGIDGAGKTTQTVLLRRSLERAAIPVSPRWSRLPSERPGRLAPVVRHLRALRRAAAAPPDGVAVLDRAVPDALVALGRAAGRTAIHRRALSRLGPRTDLTIYLRMPGAASFARRPDGQSADELAADAARYDRLLLGRGGAVVIDAERPAAEIGDEILSRILA